MLKEELLAALKAAVQREGTKTLPNQLVVLKEMRAMLDEVIELIELQTQEGGNNKRTQSA